MSAEVLDYFVQGDDYRFKGSASDFKLIRDRYQIEGDAPPFRLVDVPASAPISRESMVEDWLHIPTNSLLHVAYSETQDFDVLMGTQTHMVFAFFNGDSVVIAPKEQWDRADRTKPAWLIDALFTDTYTDFYLWGLYGLPMSYRLLSRSDYELPTSIPEVTAELTQLGYEYVGSFSD